VAAGRPHQVCKACFHSCYHGIERFGYPVEDQQGQQFGDANYDEAYVQWQRAEQAIKDYKAQLMNTGQKGTA